MRNTAGRIALSVAAIALSSGATALAEEAHIYVAAYGLRAGLSGTGDAGGHYSLDNTLGVSGSDNHTGMDLFGRIGRHRVLLGWSHGTHDGSDSVGGNLSFDGRVFGGGTVRSRVELTRRRLMYGFSFVQSSMLDFGVLVGSDGYKATTTLSQSGVGSRELAIDSPAPALGLDVGIRPPVLPLRFYVEAVFSGGEVGGTDTTLTDFTATVDWYVVPKLFGVQGGYRYYDLTADDSDAHARFDYRFDGPFLGLVFRL